MRHSLAESSQKAYLAAQQRYFKFCEEFHQPPFHLQQDLLCYFVAFLADHHICHQTIKCYLSGIRHLHVTLGHPDPDYSHSKPRLQQVLRGVRSILSKNKPQEAQHTRLPITPELLLKIRKVWEKNSEQHDHMKKFVLICHFSHLFTRLVCMCLLYKRLYSPHDTLLNLLKCQ